MKLAHEPGSYARIAPIYCAGSTFLLCLLLLLLRAPEGRHSHLLSHLHRCAGERARPLLLSALPS